MDEKLKCPICGNEFEGGTFDVCECCGQSYLGYEDELEEDEIDSANPITVKQARENFAKGLDIWGDPLIKQ